MHTIVCILHMTTALITSRGRRAILARTHLSPDREFYLRELVRLTRLAPRTVQREIDHLVEADLLTDRRDGNRRYLRANERHPLFGALREILLKSEGLVAVLQSALGNRGVEVAFVFGSMASGRAMAGSDVDLLIVGPLGLRESVRRLREVHDTIGREINPVVWTAEEFRSRLAAQDHFLDSVLREPRLMVLGDERKLGELGQEPVAETPPELPGRDRHPAQRRRR